MDINVMDFLIITIKKYCKTIENLDINKNTSIKSLKIDSISFIHIIVEIEEKFSIEFDDDFLIMEQYETLGDLEEYIIKKLKTSEADVGKSI